MLKVTIENGDYEPKDIFINDLLDLKSVTGILIDEYQKVLAEDAEREREEMKEEIIRKELENYGYDSIEDMADRIETLERAIEDIYYSAEALI